MGFFDTWKAGSLTNDGAMLSEPIYSFGYEVGVADSVNDLLDSLENRQEEKAHFYGIGQRYLVLKEAHDEYIFRNASYRHEDAVKFLVMFTAYAMGHDRIPFDWQAVRGTSQGIYTSMTKNISEHIATNVPIIEQSAEEVTRYVRDCWKAR